MVTLFNHSVNLNEIFCNPELIKLKVSGDILTTTKQYQNKLFKLSGYKSVNTVLDLEEMANYKVTELEDIGAIQVYYNPEMANYIVASSTAYECYKSLIDFLENKSNEYNYYRSYSKDNFITHDEIMIKQPSGLEYMVSIYMGAEKAYIQLPAGGVLQQEAVIDMSDPDQSDYLVDTISSKYDPSLVTDIIKPSINDKVRLTYAEYARVLSELSIIKSNKKGFRLLLDEDDQLSDMSHAIDFINKSYDMTYLERSITLTSYVVQDLIEMVKFIVSSESHNIPLDEVYMIYDDIGMDQLTQVVEKFQLIDKG